MIFNGKMIAALGVNGSNILFDFLETAFNLPAHGIEFDHLFRCKRQNGCGKRECETFVVNKSDFDLTAKRLEHTNESGKLPDGSESSSEFSLAVVFAVNDLRKPVKDGGYMQSCQKFNREHGMSSDFSEHCLGAKPTVADDLARTFEYGNQPQNQFYTDAGLCFEPLVVRKFRIGFYIFGQRHIEFLGKRQTCPASVSDKKEPGEYPAVSQNSLGGILFGSMVAGYLFPGLDVKGAINSDQQMSGSYGREHHPDKKTPQCFPWQFAGIEKVIKFLECNILREQKCEVSKNTAGLSWAAASAKNNNDAFENGTAVSGYWLSGFVEKLIEFYCRTLCFVKRHEHIISHRTARTQVVCILQ